MEHMGLLFPTCMGWRQSVTREGRAPATGGYHIIRTIIITTIIIIAIPKTVHREPNKQDKNYFPSQKVFSSCMRTAHCSALQFVQRPLLRRSSQPACPSSISQSAIRTAHGRLGCSAKPTRASANPAAD